MAFRVEYYHSLALKRLLIVSSEVFSGISLKIPLSKCLTLFMCVGYVSQAGEGSGRESGGSSRVEPRQLHSLEVIIALKPRQR